MATATPSAPVFGLAGLPRLIDSDEDNLLDLVEGDFDHAELGRVSDEVCSRRHLSNNSISTLLACPQKYGFSYDLAIERIGRALPLSMGSAFQEAIEHGDPKVGISSFIEQAGPILEQADEDERRKNATIVGTAAKAYLAHYPATEGAIREYGYRVRLRNPWTGAYSRTFDLLGYADELVVMGSGLELIENKFVGQISEVSVRKLPLDRQIALACYGVWRATGKVVTQVRYRFTRKPSIRQKQGESVEQFCERVIADYEARSDFYLHEEVLVRSPEDLVRIEAELWEWAERIRASEKRRMWPRNTSYCHEYGGCPFMAICLGDPDAASLYQAKVSNENTNPQQEEA